MEFLSANLCKRNSVCKPADHIQHNEIYYSFTALQWGGVSGFKTMA